MAITKAKKTEVLQELKDKLSKAQAEYYSDYRGLTVKQMADLRRQLKDSNVDYKVAKKTLMQIAAKESDRPEIPGELMEGPIAVAFGYDDIIAPVKALNKYAKDNEALQILGGFVEGRYISKEEAMQLANMPGREELLAKLVGTMQAPISGFHGVLHGILRSFVGTLKAYEEKKPELDGGAEEPAPVAEPVEEAKTVEPAEAPAETPAEEANAEESK
ncbi:50S ribosomal protein L10 [Candidatus Peregrinibacteria bacterium]|nr:50S ribosomal protein L10 [Candidatus Peregrinibacteria bacterium]